MAMYFVFVCEKCNQEFALEQTELAKIGIKKVPMCRYCAHRVTKYIRTEKGVNNGKKNSE